MEKSSISFFKQCPVSGGLTIDKEAIEAIRPEDMDSFSQAEAAFLRHYREKVAVGLRHMSIPGYESMLDASQEDICAELMRIHNAPDMPDPEVLGKYSPPPEE